jgi:hypothetical protein
MNDLPPGFVLDQPRPAPSAGLPDGFVLDAPAGPGPAMRTLNDVALSVDTGLAKGAAGIAGAPADIGRGVQWLVNKGQSYVQGRPFEDVEAENDRRALVSRDTLKQYGAEGLTQKLEAATHPLHKPETTAGRFAETAASFVPGAMLGPGNAARNVVGYGIIPGLTSEAAGETAEHLRASPTTQAVARLAGGVAGGLGAAVATAPGQAERALQQALNNSTPQQRQQAEALFLEANQRGLPLTRFNALDAVAQGATNLSDVQRVLEGSGRLRGFFAPTAQGVEQEGRAVFDTIAPANNAPSGIGPAVGEAAERTINDVQGRINQVTRPLYQQSDATRVGPQINAAITSDPLYAHTLQQVRADPALSRTIANMADDSGAVIDLVRRRMEEQRQNARVPGQASTSNLAAENYRDAQLAPTAALETATGSRPAAPIPQSHAIINGVPYYLNPNGTLGGPIPQAVRGTYETARAAQAALRERFLAPLMNGPLGKLQNEPTTARAIEALFPPRPIANSAGEVNTAVTELARRNPQAARDLVRAHMEGVFNEATQNLQNGPNQLGGAKAAVALRGNAQQRENLDAAIRAAAGDDVANGVNRLFEIFEAQGQRQRIGSQTSFNNLALSDLEKGNAVSQIGEAAATGGLKLPSMAREAVQRWRLGSNLDQLAQLATDPHAAGLFRQLAREGQGERATQIVSRLVGLGMRGYNSQGSRIPPPGSPTAERR